MRTWKSFLLLWITVAIGLPVFFVHAGLLLSDRDRARLQAQEREKDEMRDTAQWLMTYYVGYQNGYLKPRDVDYSLMTHIVVGGVGVRTDGALREHWHMPSGGGREMALEVGRLADRAGVKKLIWLGGPNEEDFFYAATDDAVRRVFVRNIVSLVRTLGYDGVDINWEPIRLKDEERIVALVRDLRAEAPDMILTVPVNWVPMTILARKDFSRYKELSSYADRLFIMSYSMAGPWPGWLSWHGGALSGDTLVTPGSVHTSVRAYTNAGVPKEKLGIGIGTYATCWKYPVRRPNRLIPEGFYPRDVSVMSMRTLKESYYRTRSEQWDSRARVPYLSFTRAQGVQKCGFISYENELSVAEKAQYVHEEGLGGVMVWNIGTGYYPDEPRNKRHPYLRAVRDVLKK